MEPFSTSVFKVLVLIIATTTKICAGGRYSQAYAQNLYRDPYTFLLISRDTNDRWLSIGYSFQRHPFSGPAA